MEIAPRNVLITSETEAHISPLLSPNNSFPIRTAQNAANSSIVMNDINCIIRIFPIGDADIADLALTDVMSPSPFIASICFSIRFRTKKKAAHKGGFLEKSIMLLRSEQWSTPGTLRGYREPHPGIVQ